MYIIEGMLRKQAKKIVSQLSSNTYQPLNCIYLSSRNTLSNIELIRSQHAGHTIIPVLKSNAYGHGIEQMAEILNQTSCSFLAVDGYFEATKIRDITTHPILVLGYIRPENMQLLDVKKCSFVVQDIISLRAFGALNKPIRIHIELNTGMNRLGLSNQELLAYLKVLKQFPKLKLEGVMTHLADADNELDDSFTHTQVSLFDKQIEKIKRAGFSPKYIHIAQTAGSTKAVSKYANAVRLGIGLYGINPLGHKDARYQDLEKLQPVLELKSTIIKVIKLQPGDRVSYNGIFTAPKAMKIGVLPLGYYEGVPRELSNKGVATYQGQELPIVGRVCMNHTMIDLKDLPLGVGDEVILISNDPAAKNSIQRICQDHTLFNYGLATNISSSVRRRIV